MMRLADDLFFSRSRLPLLLQTEAAECGLACLGMVAGYHGYRTNMLALRRRFFISLKGTNLATLLGIAEQLQLSPRPVKLELEDLGELQLPCILHWNLNHFVVLKSVSASGVIIHDPARGAQTLSLDEVSKRFTGVAVEFWPNPGFEQRAETPRLRLTSVLGNVRSVWGTLGQILGLAVALELFALLSPLYIQWVIDQVLVSAERELLTTLALGFGILMLLQHMIAYARTWAIMHFSTILNVQGRANILAHLLRLPVQYFQKRHLGDITSRVSAIDQIQRVLTISAVEGVLDGVMALVTVVMMFLYRPLLGWIAVAAMLVYLVGRLAWYKPLRQATEQQIVHAANQQTHLLETIRGVKTIKLFQRIDERQATWLTLLVEQVNADVRTKRIDLAYRTMNRVLFGTVNILIVWLAAKLVLDQAFTVGAMMAFIAYKSQFDARITSLIDKLFEVKMLQLQGERLADIVLSETEDTGASQPSGADTELAATIEAVGICYQYGENEPMVLEGVNLSIGEGESVAIVGESGGGKTTLLNVMLGILTPTAGDVRIGGCSVKQVGTNALRRIVGTVLQDDVLFAGSIADNICFFDACPDFKRIEECARQAVIHDDVAKMPMGYQTLVGDMGTVLSGGQKQRVLLARALYKRPKILFLDEATSHLDVAKEAEVSSIIKRLNITRIIIAHRPETIASADRVLYLNNGRIEEFAKVRAAAA